MPDDPRKLSSWLDQVDLALQPSGVNWDTEDGFSLGSTYLQGTNLSRTAINHSYIPNSDINFWHLAREEVLRQANLSAHQRKIREQIKRGQRYQPIQDLE